MRKINNLLVYERAKEEAKYIIDKKATVRQTASNFKISKSTVHKDVTKILEDNHDSLALEVREILEKNLSERHIRGGEATKRKYMKRGL